MVKQNQVKSKVDWLGDLTQYLSETTDSTSGGASKTPGGLLWWNGSSDENSLPTALGVTYIMSEYSRLFPSNPQSQGFRSLADSQLDYVFGKNPKNIPYVVGISDKSPKNPQVSQLY